MAGPGTAKQTPGFADTFGGKLFNTIDYTGVASYVNGTGELLDPKAFGFNNTIMTVTGESISQDGLNYVVCQPANNGVTAWHVRWFVVSTGLEVANTVNLSAAGKTVKISAIGF